MSLHDNTKHIMLTFSVSSCRIMFEWGEKLNGVKQWYICPLCSSTKARLL